MEENTNKTTNEEEVKIETKIDELELDRAIDLKIGLCACIFTGLAGYFLGLRASKKNTKKLVTLAEDAVRESMNDEHNAHTKALLRQICPEIGTKYIVERFDDFGGRTIGKYHSNHKLIEKVAKETAEEIVKKLNDK